LLTIPFIFTYKDIVVFPDDEDPNLFYVIPGMPHLRMDSGKPVFRGLFWTDAADGASGSVAGVRGALLNFDVNLAISDENMKAIADQVRQSGVQQARQEQMMRDERERLQRQAIAQGQNPNSVEPNVPAVGEVRFASVMYTGGNVTLLEEKSGGFVEWSSAGGPPSLIGDNNSAFALRLGAEGAAVWYRALQQDATAIGIRYELKFEARLPSLQIHVWAGSHEAFDLERKVERTVSNEDQGCSDADVEHVDVKSVTEHMVEDGLVNIEIIKGSAKISDEDVSQLRNAALSMITDRVKEILQHRLPGLTDEERKSSLIEMATQELTSFAELRLTQRDVIEWSVYPQATITNFLGGLSGDAKSKLMTLVDLSDPIVATLEMDLSVGAPWTGNPKITGVIVDLLYPGGGDDARKSITFQANTQPQTIRWRRAKNDRGLVNYTAHAFVEGAKDAIPLGSGSTNGDLHIEVPLLGTFAVNARAFPDLFTATGGGAEIGGVQLDYEYKTDKDPDHIVGTVVLTKDDANGQTITGTTLRLIDAPITITPTYLRKSSTSIPGKPTRVWVKPGQTMLVEIPSPWQDSIQVHSRVPPGVTGLKEVQVELQYEDTNNQFRSSSRLTLDDTNEWDAKTSLVVQDKTVQGFRYRYSVKGIDQLTVGPWITAEGGQDIVLPVMGVNIRTDRIKLGSTYSGCSLKMQYDDPDHKYQAIQEFFLDAKTPAASWLIPRANPNLDGYSYSMTLFKDSGQDTTIIDLKGEGSTLLLAPPPAVSVAGNS